MKNLVFSLTLVVLSFSNQLFAQDGSMLQYDFSVSACDVRMEHCQRSASKYYHVVASTNGSTMNVAVVLVDPERVTVPDNERWSVNRTLTRAQARKLSSDIRVLSTARVTRYARSRVCSHKPLPSERIDSLTTMSVDSRSETRTRVVLGNEGCWVVQYSRPTSQDILVRARGTKSFLKGIATTLAF